MGRGGARSPERVAPIDVRRRSGSLLSLFGDDDPRAEPRAGQPARGRASRSTAERRLPPLRWRRPWFLLLAPAALRPEQAMDRSRRIFTFFGKWLAKYEAEHVHVPFLEIVHAKGVGKARNGSVSALGRQCVEYDHTRHTPLATSSRWTSSTRTWPPSRAGWS